ncbi:MAG: AAA family ATPase [Proteobacteria bacterium]|nr:AAA family ATPase [Pseudomonadota bacterium]
MNQDRQLIPFRAQSEDFKVFKDEGCYYIDKTGFIRYLIEKGDKICVFTRPRRFGKTLMLRTLQTFFEYVLDENGKPVDNRRYFEGLKVMDAGEDVLKHLGQYPVISLSFKDVSGTTYEETIEQLRGAVSLACSPHENLLKNSGILSEAQSRTLQDYLDRTASESSLRQFLQIMSGWMGKATNRKTVILLDEYDVPLQQAAIYDMHHPGTDLFEKTVKLVGSFISAGFKSNSNLAYGVISGCMRVAKESIFTGMNNPGVIDVMTDELPDEFWGFTENDVKQMLAYYELDDKYQDIEQGYDGYMFGGRKVFNPWSLLNAIRGLVNHSDMAIQPYWVMTSGNDIIDDMIERNPQNRELLARMMNGETISATIYINLSYRDLKQNPDAIWSFLLYTGYLKAVKVFKNEDDLLEAELTVPNTEIRSVMRASLRHWWKNIQIPSFDTKPLANALVTADVETIEREFRLALKGSVSVFDYNEAFYHGMTVGLLRTVSEVHSNDEYGEGRPDVVTVIGETGIILEIKCVTPKALNAAGIKDNDRSRIKKMMASKLDEAVKQIHDNEYVEAVLDDEPAARKVKSYAVCFCRKWCMVRLVE